MLGSGDYGLKQAAAMQNQAYVGEAIEQQTGLVRLANQISEASAQIEYVADNLNRLSVGIHGPRPEPVTAGQTGAPNADSLSSRVSQLLGSIERLRQSYESVVR